MKNTTYVMRESAFNACYDESGNVVHVTTKEMYNNIKKELETLKEKYPRTFKERMQIVFRSIDRKNSTFDYRYYRSCFYNRFSYWNQERAVQTSLSLQKKYNITPHYYNQDTPNKYTAKHFTYIEEYGMMFAELTTDMLKHAYSEMIGETPFQLNPYNFIED